MLAAEENVCTARFLQQQDGNTLFRKLVQTLACSAQAGCPYAFRHSSRDLDMVVHGDDFHRR